MTLYKSDTVTDMKQNMKETCKTTESASSTTPTMKQIRFILRIEAALYRAVYAHIIKIVFNLTNGHMSQS
jgi:hypothetical protein